MQINNYCLFFHFIEMGVSTRTMSFAGFNQSWLPFVQFNLFLRRFVRIRFENWVNILDQKNSLYLISFIFRKWVYDDLLFFRFLLKVYNLSQHRELKNVYETFFQRSFWVGTENYNKVYKIYFPWNIVSTVFR